MKHRLLLLFLFCVPTFGAICQTTPKLDYLFTLDVQSVLVEGKPVQLHLPMRVRVVPNVEEIIQLQVGGDVVLGVRYLLWEYVDDSKTKLLHNLVFYEFANNGWQPITEVNHREPARLDEVTHWGIASSVNEKEVFSIAFDYLLQEK